MPKRNDINKILILGSGPIIIGQACEFDYSGAQACKALRKLGYKVIVVNSNPATIMTDPEMADVTYIEPLNAKAIERIIANEHPDALLPNLGGQTGLNLCLQLAREGILEKYGVKVLGSSTNAIECCCDRDAFSQTLIKLGIETLKGEIAFNIEEAEEILKKIDLPCAIRPAYTIGGTGAGLAYNLEEFRMIMNRALSANPFGQVLIEQSIEGWEELGLEVVRDAKGQKITVCFIENIDATGIHAGDSLCVTPMLTIDPELQNKLQACAYRVLDEIGIVGCAGVQFAHDPNTGRIMLIKVTPRTSQSSALASKATGLPIAHISSLIAIGMTLNELPYWKSGTLDKYSPHMDFVVIKFPRWEFEKFSGAEDRLGTQMHATGEVMSIGKNFKEALQKAVRSLEIGRLGLGFAKDFNKQSLSSLMAKLWHASSERQFIMYEALRKGADVNELYERTHIKPWFIEQIKEIVELEDKILAGKGKDFPDALLTQAKKDGFADGYLAKLLEIPEEKIRTQRASLGVVEAWESVPVSGVENAFYYYSTYNAPDSVPVSTRKKVLLLGSGPNRIGQGIEFDYCCVNAALALRDLGYETIMINCNPKTVSTDFNNSDKLYLEPLTVEDVLGIYQKEKPEGVLVQFGGQTYLSLCKSLEKAGVKILGTSTNTIDMAQDPGRFRALMQTLRIPYPDAAIAHNLKEAIAIAEKIGYPLMVSPSHDLSDLRVLVVHDKEELSAYVSHSSEIEPKFPILIEKFLENALEMEVDALSDGTDVYIPSIMEHIELAGIHSGDSACVIPPVSVSPKHQRIIEEYTKRIAIELKISGLINIQYAIADDTVYILEANPRASRTVPIVSKVCDIQMVHCATQLIMGKKIRDLSLNTKAISHYGVKEAVFPFNMFHEVDPVLGPDMRSTGEVLGMADSFELAFHKAQEAAQQLLPQEGSVLLSVSDRDKNESLAVAREFSLLGFRLKATEGTYQFLTSYGIECDRILKMNSGRPNIVDAIKNGEIQLVVNTPLGKQGTEDDSYIRKTAIKHKIPYVTTMAAARAAAKGIAAYRRKEPTVVSLQQYYARIN